MILGVVGNVVATQKTITFPKKLMIVQPVDCHVKCRQ